jgi:hypothetical protein
MTVDELADLMNRERVYIATVQRLTGLPEKKATALMWQAEMRAAQKMIDLINTLPVSRFEPSWRVALP